MDEIAQARAEKLVEAHHRFSKLLKERTRYQVVEPVLPWCSWNLRDLAGGRRQSQINHFMYNKLCS